MVGDLKPGQQVEIDRPEKNSPSSISKRNTIDDLIKCEVLSAANIEIDVVTKSIVNDIQNEGLNPEDVVVMCADDRHARVYFSSLTKSLSKYKIATNDLNATSYSTGDVFTREKAVTLTSIHRAKGNEGYSVYVMGVDALFHRPNVRTRNMIFTAMTRSKAWLMVTGIGEAAASFRQELKKAKRNFPKMIFEYPNETQLKVMKRDLTESAEQRIERALAGLIDDVSEDEIKKIFKKISSSRQKKFK